MGKEQDLLAASKNGDYSQVKKLVSKLKKSGRTRCANKKRERQSVYPFLRQQRAITRPTMEKRRNRRANQVRGRSQNVPARIYGALAAAKKSAKSLNVNATDSDG